MQQLQFMPLVNFEAVVNGRINRYLQGRTYNLPEGSLHDDLRAKLEMWAKEGKMELIEVPKRFSGQGNLRSE